jgi:GAF domain-containing protein
MKSAPIPTNEDARLLALHRLAILDTEPEERFDKITREALDTFQVPMSMITIVDTNREWFKSCQGLHLQESERKSSFCGHALLAQELFIIEDTLEDKRFADNPQVIGFPFIRFYAGVALRDRESGLPVGVFCIKDTKPRQISAKEVSLLLVFAERAEKELNKRVISR